MNWTDKYVNINLHRAPCPYCGKSDAISVERAMYTPDGKEIKALELTKNWVVVCSRCSVITEQAPSPIGAVLKWNRQELTYLSRVLHQPGYTNETEPFVNLLETIYRTAFDDYKDELSKKKEGERLDGDHWLMESSEYARRAARLQIPYDRWRMVHGCRHCARKKCPHKLEYLYRAFSEGKAPGCMREEADGT